MYSGIKRGTGSFSHLLSVVLFDGEDGILSWGLFASGRVNMFNI